jgi:hypothetical protein
MEPQVLVEERRVEETRALLILVAVVVETEFCKHLEVAALA